MKQIKLFMLLLSMLVIVPIKPEDLFVAAFKESCSLVKENPKLVVAGFIVVFCIRVLKSIGRSLGDRTSADIDTSDEEPTTADASTLTSPTMFRVARFSDLSQIDRARSDSI